MYLLSQTKIEISDIETITKQIPKPFIISGDNNAYGTTRGFEETDYAGLMIEKLLENENIVSLNDKSPTHINLANRNFSSIDLTMCKFTLV